MLNIFGNDFEKENVENYTNSTVQVVNRANMILFKYESIEINFEI